MELEKSFPFKATIVSYSTNNTSDDYNIYLLSGNDIIPYKVYKDTFIHNPECALFLTIDYDCNKDRITEYKIDETMVYLLRAIGLSEKRENGFLAALKKKDETQFNKSPYKALNDFYMALAKNDTDLPHADLKKSWESLKVRLKDNKISSDLLMAGYTIEQVKKIESALKHKDKFDPFDLIGAYFSYADVLRICRIIKYNIKEKSLSWISNAIYYLLKVKLGNDTIMDCETQQYKEFLVSVMYHFNDDGTYLGQKITKDLIEDIISANTHLFRVKRDTQTGKVELISLKTQSEHIIANVIFKLMKESEIIDSQKEYPNLDSFIKQEEKLNGFTFTDKQIDALKLCSKMPKIFILNGYAGTGKSTIVRNIINFYKSRDNAIKVVGCALSGVAADRLKNKAGIPCYTIHSLLKSDGRVFHIQRQSLEADLIVLDEAGMVDSVLFSALINAIDFSRSKLIIVGDEAQLPPIGSGDPFRVLLNFTQGELKIPNVTLDEVQRSKGAIIEWASIIRTCQDTNNFEKQLSKKVEIYEDKYFNKETLSIVSETKENDKNIECSVFFELFVSQKASDHNLNMDNFPSLIENKIKEYVISKKDEDLLSYQIICPQKSIKMGTVYLNNFIQDILHDSSEPYVDCGLKKFYIGDKVINIENNKPNKAFNYDFFEDELTDKKVFNGWIGVVEEIDFSGNIKVNFPANGESITYSTQDATKNLELAYVLTAHKVQGNEFDDVLMIIPERSNMLTKKYIYSAFTRAKYNVWVLGYKASFLRGLNKKEVNKGTNRRSNKKESLEKLINEKIENRKNAIIDKEGFLDDLKILTKKM